MQDGSPNPLHGVVSGECSRAEPRTLDRTDDALPSRRRTAIDWEAKLSLPDDQPAGILTALGLKLGPHAAEDAVQRLKARKTTGRKGLPTIGGFRNIMPWSLWPGATVLVVGGLLALAFQWRTLGRTFASIFSGFGGQRNARKGPLDHIEIPMTWFVFGFLVTGMSRRACC